MAKKGVVIALVATILTVGVSLSGLYYHNVINNDNKGYIESVELTSKTNELSVYKVTYTNGTCSFFYILNGRNGQEGIQGIPGEDGHTHAITINEDGYLIVDGINTNKFVGAIDGINGTDGKDGTKGEPGDPGIDGIDGEKGDPGDPGINGQEGINGTDGVDGTVLLTGNEDPTALLGKDGDTYYNVSSCDLYLKQDGNWILKANLKGDAGQDGIDGKDSDLYYKCIFKNYDGSVLDVDYVLKGETAKYSLATPTRPSTTLRDQPLDFTFVGWDKELTNINSFTVFVAQYEKSLLTVNFLNLEKNLITCTTLVKRGETALYTGPSLGYTEGNYMYYFEGWDKDITNVQEDMDVAPLPLRKVAMENLGSFPQTMVTDESIIEALNNITEVNSRGYKEYLGYEYYEYDKCVVHSDIDITEVPINGGKVVDMSGTVYFKVEPIEWVSFTTSNGKAAYYSKNVLIGKCFNDEGYHADLEGIYNNNYEYSSIRNWLNNDFINIAFTDEQKEFLVESETDNSLYSVYFTTCDYICNNTMDKAFLMSNREYQWITTNFTKYPPIQITDFAIATGIDYNTTDTEYFGNTFSLFRSPSKGGKNYICVDASQVYSSFYFQGDTDEKLGIQPCVIFDIPDSYFEEE